MNICLYTSKQFTSNSDYFNNPHSLILKVETCSFGLRPQHTVGPLVQSRFKQLDKLTDETIAVQVAAIPLLSPSSQRRTGRFIETLLKLQSSDQGEYLGQCKEGKPNGLGRFVSATGITYEGAYNDGLRDGYGMMTVNGIHYFQKWESGCLIKQIGEYQGEFKDGLPHGLGELRISDSQAIVKGNFEMGILQGLGTLEGSTRTFRSYKYVGSFQDGYFHGKGQNIYNNLFAYEGDFNRGKKEGFGVLSFLSGEILYIGEWLGNRPNGPGTQISNQGLERTGNWKNGWLEGAETPINALNLTFEGPSINGIPEGEGRVAFNDPSKGVGLYHEGIQTRELNNLNEIHSFSAIFDDVAENRLFWQARDPYKDEVPPVERMFYLERIYAKEYIEAEFNGEWFNDQPHGDGTCTYQDGTEYQGSFAQGRKHGQGMRKGGTHRYLNFWQNGKLLKEVGEYMGSAIFGHPDGMGILKTPTGITIKGIFENGSLNGLGAIETDKGRGYKGHLVDWVPEGQGTAELPNGDTYVGKFSKGAYEGEGIYTFAYGTMNYLGQFKNDMKEGLGKLFGYDGEFAFCGEWKQDLPNGEGSLLIQGQPFLKGRWKNGWLVGHEQLVNAWGGKYSGATEEGIPHGRGMLKQMDGTVVEADFIEGIISTVHAIKTIDGTIVENVEGNLRKAISASSSNSESLTPTEVMTPPLGATRPESTTPPTSIPDLDSPDRNTDETSSDEGSQSGGERDKDTAIFSAQEVIVLPSYKNGFPTIQRPPLSRLHSNTLQLKRTAQTPPMKPLQEEEDGEEDKENRPNENGKKVKLTPHKQVAE